MEHELDALEQAEKIINDESRLIAHQEALKSYLKKVLRRQGILPDDVEDV